MMGRRLVKVPFFSMVNLVAGRRIVPEFIQNEMTAARLADEALRLLDDEAARQKMRRELALVVQKAVRTRRSDGSGRVGGGEAFERGNGSCVRYFWRSWQRPRCW